MKPVPGLGSRLQLVDLMLFIGIFTLSLSDVQLSVDAVEEDLTSCFFRALSHVFVSSQTVSVFFQIILLGINCCSGRSLR